MILSQSNKKLIIKGATIVYIDWANVHGWESSLKQEIDSEVLFSHLKPYPEIQDMRLYFGKDTHPKSSLFLHRAKETGFTVITKEVKYILIAEVEGQKIYRRKCDFDMEICIDVHEALENDIRTFIFFTGDGDFAPLYQKLIRLGKQVIVVYAHGHLGREIWAMKKGVFKVQIRSIVDLKNNAPPIARGA